MKRITIVYGVLLIAALLGAYFTWTDEEPDGFENDENDGVVVADVEPKNLEKIVYEGEEFEATLVRKEDDFGAYLWAETKREVSATPRNPHDPHAALEKDDDGESKTVTKSFKAGAAGTDLIDDVAPLRMLRRLDDVDDEKLEAFGLDEPRGTLTIHHTGGEEVFDVGARGYGHRNVYLRHRESEEIYLADSALMSKIERADTRLPERELFEYDRKDIAKISVTTAERSFDLVHENRDDARADYWATPGASEPNRVAESWLDKALSLRVSGYVPEGEKPGQTDTAFAYTVHPADGKPVKVEVFRGASAEDGEQKWYGRSDYTRGLVELDPSRASDAADDVASVLNSLGSGE